MIDYAGLYKQLMADSNRVFVKQIQEEQEKEKKELEAQADCQCNGGGFAYCEACYGE